MRHEVILALVVVAGSLQTRAQPAALKEISWLSGCWRMESGDRVIDEVWMPARGGMMLGMGRTVRGDNVMDYEFLRIYLRSGTLIYAANPSGQTPAEFVAKLPVRDSVVFENPAHDFPQRLIYKKTGNDLLDARVEGTINGRVRSQSFHYRRADCRG